MHVRRRNEKRISNRKATVCRLRKQINKMKKYILIFAIAFLLIGCTAEELPNQVKKDCNCNRVVEVTSFNLAGSSTFGTYTTINDCTGIQKQGNWSNEYNKPQKGSCK